MRFINQQQFLIGVAFSVCLLRNHLTEGTPFLVKDGDDGLIDDEDPQDVGCENDYECQFFVVAGDGNLYEYQLEGELTTKSDGLCSESFDYRLKNGSKHYYFNICGTTHGYCLPTNYRLPYYRGVAIQYMSDPDDHDDDVGECSLPFSNVTMACTVDCEVLGKADPPLFELIDNNSPEKGIILNHFGEPGMDEDKYQCPFDEKRGGYVDRQVIYHIMCDDSAAPGNPYILSVTEDPPCTYTFVMRALEACPLKWGKTSGSSSSNNSSGGSHSGLAAGMFFFGLLLTAIILFGVWKFRQGGYALSDLQFWNQSSSTPKNAFATAGSSTYTTVRT